MHGKTTSIKTRLLEGRQSTPVEFRFAEFNFAGAARVYKETNVTVPQQESLQRQDYKNQDFFYR